MISKKFLENLYKNNYNKDTIVSLIAYGSSAIPQAGNVGKMLDLLIITNNCKYFHMENLAKNKHHYSFISRTLGVEFIVGLNKVCPQVYFNHSVKLLNQDNKTEVFAKYGVVELSNLKKDLLFYENLFILGRLHKPVIKFDVKSEDIKLNQDVDDLNTLIENNKTIATKIALILTLNNECVIKDFANSTNYDNFLKEFFTNLVSLSYTGDIRFKLKGEKKNKVEDIVSGGFNNLKEYYEKQLSLECEFLKSLKTKLNSESVSSECIYNLLSNLPRGFITRLKIYNNFYRSNDDFIKYLSFIKYDKRRVLILSLLQHNNLRVSFNALIIGLITSPILKGFFYVFRKLSKSLLNK